MNSIITSIYYITNKTELSHKYSEGNKKIYRGSSISQGRRLVDHSLEILRKIIIPKAICYESGIFIQIIKINKRKYMSYSTSVTRGS